MCAIIADSLMSTSNEMCGGFLVHTMSTAVYASAIRYTCAYKLPHASNHERSIYTEGMRKMSPFRV